MLQSISPSAIALFDSSAAPHAPLFSHKKAGRLPKSRMWAECPASTWSAEQASGEPLKHASLDPSHVGQLLADSVAALGSAPSLLPSPPMPQLPLPPSLPPSLPVLFANLAREVAQRCERFQSPSDRRLAFTHIPKSAGGSMELLLQREASRSSKRICDTNLWYHRLNATPKHPHAHEEFVIRTWDELRSATVECDVLIGHSPFVIEEDYLSNGILTEDVREPRTFLTLLREPNARAESSFRFKGGYGLEFAAKMIAANVSLQALFDDYHSSRISTQVAWLHAPRGVWLESQNVAGDNNSRALPWFRTMPAGGVTWKGTTRERPISTHQLHRVMEWVAQRYAVVGVLERIAETMEVLQCRLGARFNMSFPLTHTDNFNRYPIKLVHNASVLQRYTSMEQPLYKLANKILTADVACCRSRARLDAEYSDNAFTSS